MITSKPVSNPKKRTFPVQPQRKIYPTSYGAHTPESPVNTGVSAPSIQGGSHKRVDRFASASTSVETTPFVEHVMNKKRFTTPFQQYLYQDTNGYFNVRLGPKIYLVKVSLDYTPNFDNEFLGGKEAPAFNWNSILVKDTPESQPRPITQDELTLYWFKPNIKKVVNYQRAIKRRARSQSPRYSKEQRIAYRNNQYNNA